MNAQLPLSRVMATLVTREFQEHRLMFVYMPLLLALAAMAWFTVWLVQDSSTAFALRFPESLRNEAAPPFPALPSSYLTGFYRNTLNGMFISYEALMLMAFWGSMAYYYLFTLYQQRRDRSILFWNSLPVSDARTIASKLLAGLVACNVLYMLCFVAISVFMHAAVWLYAVFAADGEHWDNYLRIAQPFSSVTQSFLNMPLGVLLALPVYGWLLLASAWSRRAPFAWATGPWLVVILAELAFKDYSWLLDKIAWHLIPLTTSLPDRVRPTELLVGVVLGLAFIYAATRLNRSDDS